MGDKEDYLTLYRVFFENFAATVNPEDQLPVNIAGYTITESELPGEVIYWTTQYLTEKQCPLTLMTPLRRIVLDEVRVASKKHPSEFGYKSDESVYIALRLMQAVTARVNNVCLRYLDNSKLDTLPPPPPLEKRDLKTVSCATKNGRRAMEDRHVEIGNLEALFGKDTTVPTSFYAVYDGHAGSAAATYCAAHLHQYLIESPHFVNDLERAMRDAYLRTDAEFIRKSNQERACGGSTAVTVCVRGSQLVAAWAGDSQALLAKRMGLMQLVRPHKPGRQDERERIEKSGGTVIYWGTWRVNGQLAVSRAIGDAQYKPYVTARPEIATVDLDGDEDFVVIACDGLWDYATEDDIALSVYKQLAADPNDLKAVTKRLIVLAKKEGSADNISIIVVFLKDPRKIVSDNYLPMDLGLENTVANAAPFAAETESCRRQVDVASGGDADAEGEPEPNNGHILDNSDSDSEDLGPETAVDVDDIDVDKNHEPAAPTPPAHTVEQGHVDGALVDNVAESGEDSEDEWDYIKGEGEREVKNLSDEPEEAPRSETPCQDTSGCESSSVDMNSSPLNPEAPVFVPGSVASDVLLAESPRKPLPMDDIELPDDAQFRTEAVVRPADLLDLDNCDQLNGHHNNSIDESAKEHLNGNNNCNMDSLGFGFNVGIEPDKVKDMELIQDFERIQKDTTDFCNIQVFQTHTEANPFAVEGNDELFERLKNKERDPMSMSFYQEKDDDTCERLMKNDLQVDLNAVQPLPDSDDEDIQQNGVCEKGVNDKENVNPKTESDLFAEDSNTLEPNNDIMILSDRNGALSNNVCNFNQEDNFVDYNAPDNLQSFTNIEFETSSRTQETVLQTDTPESHKLMFEQIPEIPDGKSSELGFTNDEQDHSESEKDVRAITPLEETQNKNDLQDEISSSEIRNEIHDDIAEPLHKEFEEDSQPEEPTHSINELKNEIVDELKDRLEEDYDKVEAEIETCIQNSEDLLKEDLIEHMDDFSPDQKPIENVEHILTPEVTSEAQEDIVADIHAEEQQDIPDEISTDPALNVPEIKLHEALSTEEITESSVPSPQPAASPLPSENLVNEIDERIPSPANEPELLAASPKPSGPSTPKESLSARESPLPPESPLPTEPTLSKESLLHSDSPLPVESSLPVESPLPEVHAESPLPTEPVQEPEVLLPEESLPSESPVPVDTILSESSVPAESLVVEEPAALSPSPIASSPAPCELKPEEKDSRSVSPLPAEVPLPRESPVPVDIPSLTDNLVSEESTFVSETVTSYENVETNDSDIHSSIETTFDSIIEKVVPVQDQPPEISNELSEALIQTTHDDTVEQSVPIETSEPSVLEEPIAKDLPPVSVDPSESTQLDVAVEEPIVAVSNEKLSSVPAPDVVPEERVELVTDIDIGIPEMRAQEICVPMTNEIRPEEAEQPPAAATPPPTPAVDLTAAAAPAAIVAAAAAATAAVATAAAGSKAKPLSSTKKSPTTPTAKLDSRTPKSGVKTSTPRSAPASAKKSEPVTKGTPTSARTPIARTTPSATKTTPKTTAAAPARASAPAARPPLTKPAALTKTTTVRSTTTAPKPTTTATKSTTTVTKTTVASKTTSATARSTVTQASRTTTTKPTTPTSKPIARETAAAPKPAAPKAPAARVPAARAPAPRPAPLAAAKPRPKPLTNGDVKDAKPTPRPAATRAAPAAARPATLTKTTTTSRTLDKQSKDLANKRITAKTAPPRTATAKPAVGSKNTVPKAVPKKPIESLKKEQIVASLSNGDVSKEAPSPPPAADNALLPDVIA